jgi:hypothetical protein
MNFAQNVRPFSTGLAVFVLLTALSNYIHHQLSETDGTSFNILCHLDHVAPNDPIVHPGMPGMSHLHLFFGNHSTNANTTTHSLQTTSSSCSRGMGKLDLSAYWVPALYYKTAHGAMPVTSKQQTLAVYFQRAGGTGGPKVRPFPAGLRMVAGNAMAASAQSTNLVWWKCGDLGDPLAGIPQCTFQRPIDATLTFPNCWDGRNLDSTDHKSHMAYPDKRGTCPSGHPVVLPRMTYHVTYPGIPGGPRFFLASGGIYSYHGDFMNAWNDKAQAALVATCLNAPRDCNDLYSNGNTIFRLGTNFNNITL